MFQPLPRPLYLEDAQKGRMFRGLFWELIFFFAVLLVAEAAQVLLGIPFLSVKLFGDSAFRKLITDRTVGSADLYAYMD
ncbi:MAG: hypothetical protein MJ078_01390, partial [Clostridia bacterium]|nr:hypothetical protein [Clostridia bacterium]